MRRVSLLLLSLCLAQATASAEVTNVTITSRKAVAGGQTFGTVGAYEKLTGRITFALDPNHARNKAIVDLGLAPLATDKRVHFSADLFVLQPADRSKGNGVLLFEVANRGRKGLIGMFNGGSNGNDPDAVADFGDGFLLREGYTLVWVGWQSDVAAPQLTIAAPRPDFKGKPDTVRITFIVDAAAPETSPAGLPRYRPFDANDASATLSVRDRFWSAATPLPRAKWAFVPTSEQPRIRLEGGFEPGRVYELTYPSVDGQVAGVGFAAMRDAASAFRYRDDLPVSGTSAYIFGISQSGRFLRQFLAEGFNVDEKDRRSFDAVWPHIAGAGLGSFNERFAKPGYSSFDATRFPFADSEAPGPDGARGGLLAGYAASHQPKIFYTDTPVEYWGQGRAAALTHVSADGTTDLTLPDNVRRYFLTGTQHGPSAFPPNRNGSGQESSNPVAQRQVMRALLRALHQWTSAGTAPPASRYPRLADKTLVRADQFVFPALAGVGDLRATEGPSLRTASGSVQLPYLVPQVDADGNELAGIRVPDVSVPLATTTGWNFRASRVGNPTGLYPLLGSYLPFPRTRADRASTKDPRRSIEERYSNKDAYLRRTRTAAMELVKGRYVLEEDVESIMTRAADHWDWATGTTPSRAGSQ
jgi:hypothetical protein